jgi:hypothetical protein
VPYLLLADDHTYVWRSWDALVGRLVWAHGRGYATAKARLCTGFTDRPLMRSEAVALVESATELVLAAEREDP